MISRDLLLDRLEPAEQLVELFLNKKKESKATNRFKKFLTQPYKYSLYTAYKAGLIPNRDIRARTFWGSDMVLPLGDENAAIVFFTGTLGAAECALSRFIIKTLKEGEVFYDIGANLGFYSSLALALVGSTGEVHAFEPGPRVAHYVRENGVGAEVNNVALSDAEGEAVFFDTSGSHKSGMSTLVAASIERSGIPFERVVVPTVTLDRYISRHRPPTFLKIDVDGSEEKVLAGATQFLRNHAPTLVMEVWDAPHIVRRTARALELLKGAGYQSYQIVPSGTLVRAEIALGQVGELNNFCFRKR